MIGCQDFSKGFILQHLNKNLTPWPSFACELYLRGDRRLSAKLLPNLRVECVSWLAQRIPTPVNLDFLDVSRYYFYSISFSIVLTILSEPSFRSLLLRKYIGAGNRSQDIWICSEKL
jgi:hypothetical protein